MTTDRRCSLGLRGRDLPDFRDADYSFRAALAPAAGAVVASPPEEAEAKNCAVQPLRDQGKTSSCVGQAWAFVHQAVRKVTPGSALAIYAECRKMDGELDRDEGTFIRHGAKVVSEYGAPLDQLWPDVPANLFLDPDLKADKSAARRRVMSYHRLDRGDVRACIASGFPLAVGVACFDPLFADLAAVTGVVEMPTRSAGYFGGHAVAPWAYWDTFRDSKVAWEVARNSGRIAGSLPERVVRARGSWGRYGFMGDHLFDARYFEDAGLSGDFWTVRKVA